MLREDRDAVLKTIKALKEVLAKDISEKLNLTVKHIEVICKSLMDDYSIMKNSKGEFMPMEKDATTFLRLIAEFGWASINRIVCRMKITPAYAKLLCRNLEKQGYLKKAHDEAYALVNSEQL